MEKALLNIQELKDYIRSFIPKQGFCADFEYFNIERVLYKLEEIEKAIKNH